jgi:hypothetical protein
MARPAALVLARNSEISVIGDPGLHPLAVREHLIEQRPPVELWFLDQAVSGLHVLADLLLEARAIAQVAHADSAPADLVLVRRTDST